MADGVPHRRIRAVVDLVADARFLAFELKPAYFNIKNWFVSVQRPVQGTASR